MVEKVDFDHPDDPVRTLDGSDGKSGDGNGGETAERAAAIVGELARRVGAGFGLPEPPSGMWLEQMISPVASAAEAILPLVRPFTSPCRRKSRIASVAMAPAELLSCIILRMNPIAAKCHIYRAVSPRHDGERRGLLSIITRRRDGNVQASRS
ncbi:hypothetical protein [Rhizobium sp. AN95]|uniref:hypothetical protein n=1 Tax=Rhizobium sp. AN95 TaxID=3035216 RepID=UPI002B264155|nr:hypothetical protein [Rhizobium sp. AN95]